MHTLLCNDICVPHAITVAFARFCLCDPASISASNGVFSGRSATQSKDALGPDSDSTGTGIMKGVNLAASTDQGTRKTSLSSTLAIGVPCPAR